MGRELVVNLCVLDDISPELSYGIRQLFFHETKTREDVLRLEEEIKDLPTAFEGNPYPLFHSFADGMYTREIHFNKGDFIVGAIHKNEYFVNVVKGRIWVVSEFGAKEIVAPCSFKAKAGVKHIGFTLEDTVWIDTHKVSTEDIKEAEKEIFCDSYEELDEYNGVISYSQMCADIGLTKEDVRLFSETEEDLIEQPEDPIEIKESEIEGKGVFVTKDFLEGERVALARQDNARTPVGRYTNHSDEPNSIGEIEDNKAYFTALKDIKKGAEITVDYREIREKAELLDEVMLCQVG